MNIFCRSLSFTEFAKLLRDWAKRRNHCSVFVQLESQNWSEIVHFLLARQLWSYLKWWNRKSTWNIESWSQMSNGEGHRFSIMQRIYSTLEYQFTEEKNKRTLLQKIQICILNWRDIKSLVMHFISFLKTDTVLGPFHWHYMPWSFWCFVPFWKHDLTYHSCDSISVSYISQSLKDRTWDKASKDDSVTVDPLKLSSHKLSNPNVPKK